MSLFSRYSSLMRNLFSRRRMESDLSDELNAYLDGLTEEKQRSGMALADARRAARIELGGMEQVKEEVRHVRSGRVVEELVSDLHYGLRTLRKSPAFTVVAILVLALGIGANAAMFSVAYGILLRPLPYKDADRVAVVYMRYFPRDFAFGTLCMRDYLMWKENNRSFEEPSLFRYWRVDVGSKEGVPEQIEAAAVTAGFFTTLGVAPLIGRVFVEGDDKPSAGSLTLIGEALWRRRFGASPSVLGQTILINGSPSTVIGVMPESVQFPRKATDAWTNLILTPPTRYGPWFYRGIARLKPGISMAQAQAEINNIGLRMMQQNAYYKRLTLPIASLRDAMLGTTIKPAMLVLAGAVGLVLLIAVVNVANLMLARATVREREMALRLSLGATRGRLIRQLITESGLLAMMGGVAGLGLAYCAIELVRVWNPGNLPLIDSVRLDAGALGFVLLISILTGVLFGTAPAIESARTDLNATVNEGARGGGPSRARGRARAALVVSEIAVSLMLLLGASLLLRSFVNLQGVSGGFSTPPRQVLTMLISPGNQKYRESRTGLAFYDEVLRRARAVPGVEAAALTDSLPPDRQGDADSFELESKPLEPGQLNPIITAVTIGSDYFHALRVPLLKGRYFTDHDNEDSRAVAIVSEGFASRFLPGLDPIGQRMKQSGPDLKNKWMEIVGVVGNVKYMGLTVDSDPAYYMPLAQTYGQRMFLAIRSSEDAANLAPALRRDIQSIDPGVTLAQVSTMEQALAASISQPRFDTMLLVLFAGIAVILAAVGIYGLIAYSVAQRTHEIGVRMALGAARTDVVLMVVRQGAVLATIGIALGLAGAFGLTGLLKTMVFGIGVTDALTFAAAPVGMMLVVLVATSVPAFRATRISPIIALRYE